MSAYCYPVNLRSQFEQSNGCMQRFLFAVKDEHMGPIPFPPSVIDDANRTLIAAGQLITCRSMGSLPLRIVKWTPTSRQT
jgi:hypothetical protein